MKKSRIGRTYWGLVLIAVAVLVILKCIGVDIGFVGTLPVTDVILSLIITSVMVVFAVSFDFQIIPFGLAVIFMLFESEIAAYLGRENPNIISNWLLLGCALLVSVGLSLIFSPLRKHRFHHACEKDGKNIRFGSESKYIDCTTFEYFSYSVKMGEGSLYFENPENYKGNGVLNVECKMGELNIKVPSAWHIVTDIDTGMGTVNSDGCGTQDGPLLTVRGICKMGDINISYC